MDSAPTLKYTGSRAKESKVSESTTVNASKTLAENDTSGHNRGKKNTQYIVSFLKFSLAVLLVRQVAFEYM